MGRRQVLNGYSDTPADGDCGVHAVYQSLRLLEDPSVSVENLKKDVKDAVKANRLKMASALTGPLRCAWSDQADRRALLKHFSNYDAKFPRRASDDQIFEFVATPAVEGGPWVNPLLLACLAVAIERPIVVVDEINGGMTVYPARFGAYKWDSLPNYEPKRSDSGLDCSWTSRGTNVWFLPDVVFLPTTVVIVHGRNHFWCTTLVQPGPLHDEDKLRNDATTAGIDVRSLVIVEDKEGDDK